MNRIASMTTRVCALLWLVLSVGAVRADDQSELLDRLQIMELQSRYALAHDLTDPAAYAAVFTDDAELVSAGGKVLAKGSAALRAVAAGDRKRFNAGAADNVRSFGSMRHVITNQVIDITGRDTATGICYVQTIANRKDHGPEILSIGRYEDSYRKVNGKWLIARREIVSDWGNDALVKQIFGN
ncbi:MAG TPA: nuclear transport factor 2 family protein [Candidatus Acidoferrum sp.]|nr:nuclear transport factor 2 family protein [Candidatus Acidoferrum sp.]